VRRGIKVVVYGSTFGERAAGVTALERMHGPRVSCTLRPDPGYHGDWSAICWLMVDLDGADVEEDRRDRVDGQARRPAPGDTRRW
jgi:hypothetical protein